MHVLVVGAWPFGLLPPQVNQDPEDIVKLCLVEDHANRLVANPRRWYPFRLPYDIDVVK